MPPASSDTMAEQTLAPAAQPVASVATDARCKALAQQRSDDADANGLDEDLQKTIYSGTYAECVSYAATHMMN